MQEFMTRLGDQQLTSFESMLSDINKEIENNMKGFGAEIKNRKRLDELSARKKQLESELVGMKERLHEGFTRSRAAGVNAQTSVLMGEGSALTTLI